MSHEGGAAPPSILGSVLGIIQVALGLDIMVSAVRVMLG